MGVVGGKVRSVGRAPARAAQVPSPYYHMLILLLTFILILLLTLILLTFILTFFSFKWIEVATIYWTQAPLSSNSKGLR